MPRFPLPVRCRCRDRRRGRGRRQRRLPPRRGGRRRRPVERDQLASGSTSKAAGRPARPVLGRAQHRDRQAQPGGVQATSSSGRAGRSTTRRSATCSCSPRESEVDAFQRSVALQNELGVPSRIITPDEARELCPLIAGEDILAAELLPDRRARHARVGRAGLRDGARPRRAPRRPTPVEGIDVATAPIKARAHAARAGRDRHGDLRRGRLVARVRGDGRRRARRHAAAPPGAVHRADGRPPGQAAADDRLHDRLLLPPRRPRAADGHGRPERDARAS